ncbi:GAF domain-containing protein [Chitinibacter fontanus]|uniref:GAF domain-containing protein n=1 Tax=Chitinibacter fontanus TaxID=1737446 RepID=A0A7D5V945_9NEIS|nr:ATP-binding protein [Chitinibacter fontanus]QLI80892.1 GAF domain-containing protein [Chitinibacter fontanus]
MPNATVIADELAAQLAHIESIYHQQPLQARQACEALIGHARQQHATLLQIYAAELYGKIMDHAGEAITARNLLYEAAQQAQAIHNFRLEARVCEQIARSHYTAGEYPTALQNWLRCIELSEFKQGEAAIWMMAKVGVGQVYDALGECQTALLFHQKALNRIHEVNDPYLHAKILINIGVVQLKLDQLSQAKIALETSRQICLANDYADYAATSYSRLAEIALKENQLDDAMSLLTEALSFARKVNYRWGEATILSNMAQIHSRHQRYDAALECIFTAQVIAKNHHFTPVLMRLHQAAAHNAEQAGQIALAIQELKAGVALQTALQQAQQSEQNNILVQKTNLRASASSKLVNLANHRLIEHGDQADYWPLLAQESASLLQLERVSIWLLSEDKQRLECQYARQETAQMPVLERRMMPVFFSSLEHNQPIIAHDAAHHHFVWDIAKAYLAERHIYSIMAFPIHHNDRIYILLFEQTGQQRNWLPDEIKVGNQLANIAARALGNQDRREFQDEIHILNARLSEAHTELENRVQERTQGLLQSNAELEQTMSQLVQTEKMAALGRLVTGISNELIPPLIDALEHSNVLNQHSKQIAQQLSSGQLKRSSLEQYIATTEAQGKIIEDKIALASELVGQFKLIAVDTSSERRRHFNLYETVSDLAKMLSRQLRHQGHRILLNIPRQLELDSFPGPLEQILTHLIQNAVFHGFAQRRAGVIEISAYAQGDEIIVECHDNGIGIAPEQLQRVLEPFYTRALHNEHSGLGLYIANNLLSEVLAGKLEIESALGQYTKVKLRIPRIAPESQAAEVQA